MCFSVVGYSRLSNGVSMGMKSWFDLVKKLFVSDKQPKTEKVHTNRRTWLFFGRFKVKSKLAAIEPPPPPRQITELREAQEEQSKHALNVALATVAAVEAAVVAAQAAAEVVLRTGVPRSVCQYGYEIERSAIRKQPVSSSTSSSCTHLLQREIQIQEFSALKIQAAFRGYLARKASRALKGIVKLQAIIRGRNVRRQAVTTLKCLESLVNIQSRLGASRHQPLEGTWKFDENEESQNLNDDIIKMDMNSQKRWDRSILTKEEADALFLSKKEAVMKRERIREYSFSHQSSAETERNNGRWKRWLDQWVDTRVAESRELEYLDSILAPDSKHRVESRGKQLKLGLDSTMTAPRRSFHRKQSSVGEENCFSSSPLPTYMAVTESAKAKARSTSSPKLRTGGLDAYSDSYSPSKNRVSASEMLRSGKLNAYQQRSPSLKGIQGPVKSSRTLKDLSFISDKSFRTWDQHSEFGC
ncbi:hypothetical protein K2173_011334 [Erythroxylum novogranatense]|uniref:DUF4005 domain-containing protein n=1 Tax=Erythroxylum novogranatense TaxID=1862640 RepID=A0AAV8S9I3_9ROSI|nr:hypothetical protein K2173_011334 [Erythroxylum novogranatense]